MHCFCRSHLPRHASGSVLGSHHHTTQRQQQQQQQLVREKKMKKKKKKSRGSVSVLSDWSGAMWWRYNFHQNCIIVDILSYIHSFLTLSCCISLSTIMNTHTCISPERHRSTRHCPAGAPTFASVCPYAHQWLREWLANIRRRRRRKWSYIACRTTLAVSSHYPRYRLSPGGRRAVYRQETLPQHIILYFSFIFLATHLALC